MSTHLIRYRGSTILNVYENTNNQTHKGSLGSPTAGQASTAAFTFQNEVANSGYVTTNGSTTITIQPFAAAVGYTALVILNISTAATNPGNVTFTLKENNVSIAAAVADQTGNLYSLCVPRYVIPGVTYAYTVSMSCTGVLSLLDTANSYFTVQLLN